MYVDEYLALPIYAESMKEFYHQYLCRRLYAYIYLFTKVLSNNLLIDQSYNFFSNIFKLIYFIIF